jgi:hypothetical protein
MTKNIFIFLLHNPSRLVLSSPSKARSQRTKPKIETTKMTTTNSILTLQHNQTVRGAGFPVYAQRISVGTARGYSAEYNDNQEEAHQRAINNGHPTAWANQDAACLTADYPGKAEAHAAYLKEIADAVELHNGQKVEIEGEVFTVRLVGSHVSDPIHFIRF